MGVRVVIDIETRSGAKIADCGSYRYALDPDFAILLLAYKIGDAPSVCIEWEGADKLPQDLVQAMRGGDVLVAHNAQFEYFCLGVAGCETNLERWEDTMIEALYAGYPAQLAQLGEALQLPEEDKKLSTGKALIRYFCVPMSETDQKKYGRKFHVKADDPERWELFMAYCKQDVDTEATVDRILSAWPVPEREWKLWRMDVRMNCAGVGVDVDLMAGALRIIESSTAALETRAKELTGLANPNSPAQLRAWLEDRGVAAPNLTKQTVADLIADETIDDDVREVLKIRQELGKSSLAKYSKIETALCPDGRVRGISQFYGANRTGRYSGKLVQMQNLPRNYMDGLEDAREIAKLGDYALMRMLYGNVPDTLSQLIRTVFVPSDGHKFVVADFSAIEARVLAWMAGEQWVLDAFAAGKDIYCETASMMYHVPVVKHGENGELRAKGKVATLACIAEGQEVLTDAGLVPIERVTKDMRVWDGAEWVSHEGVVCRGEKEVISYDGLEATEDHIVWAEIDGEHRTLRFGDAARSGAHLTKSGAGREAIRLAKDHQPGEEIHEGLEPVHGADGVHRMRQEVLDVPGEHDAGEDQGMPELQPEEGGAVVAGQTDDSSEAEMREPERPTIQELRSEGHPVRLSERDGCLPIHDRELRDPRQGDGDRPDQRQRQLCSGEPSVGGQEDKPREQTHHGAERVRSALLAVCGNNGQAEAVSRDEQAGDHQRCDHGSGAEAERLETHPRKARVYDIRLAGPCNRFTVSDVLVHNCGYQGSIGAMKAMDPSGAIPEAEMQQVVDAWRQANPHIVALWRRTEDAALRAVVTGCPQALEIPGGAIVYNRETDICSGMTMLTVQLPTGRKLHYAEPDVKENRFGRPALHFKGLGDDEKPGGRAWGTKSTYGGSLVENLTQSIARDCLTEILLRIDARGLQTVFHVHDEVIVDCPQDAIDVKGLCDLMAEPIPWAPGLLLKGAGFEGEFYMKD